MASVLVTGSSGFIGTHVVRHLVAAGHKVIGYDLRPPQDRFPDGSIYCRPPYRTRFKRFDFRLMIVDF